MGEGMRACRACQVAREEESLLSNQRRQAIPLLSDTTPQFSSWHRTRLCCWRRRLRWLARREGNWRSRRRRSPAVADRSCRNPRLHLRQADRTQPCHALSRRAHRRGEGASSASAERMSLRRLRRAARRITR